MASAINNATYEKAFMGLYPHNQSVLPPSFRWFPHHAPLRFSLSPSNQCRENYPIYPSLSPFVAFCFA